MMSYQFEALHWKMYLHFAAPIPGSEGQNIQAALQQLIYMKQ